MIILLLYVLEKLSPYCFIETRQSIRHEKFGSSINFNGIGDGIRSNLYEWKCSYLQRINRNRHKEHYSRRCYIFDWPLSSQLFHTLTSISFISSLISISSVLLIIIISFTLTIFVHTHTTLSFTTLSLSLFNQSCLWKLGVSLDKVLI